MTLAPGGALAGTVTDPSGAPVRRFRILQHFVSNVRLELTAEGVRVQSYVLAKHGYVRDGAMVFFAMGGEYEDLVVREGGFLRIARRTLRARWFEGDIPPP